MARVSADDVKKILLLDYDTARSPDLAPFIARADRMVDRVVACAIENEDPMSDDEAADISAYLAAHLYCVSDRIYTSRSTDNASGSVAGSYGMGLDSTPYGQQAKMIDPSNCLSRNTGQKVGGFWAGTPIDLQKDAEDANASY